MSETDTPANSPPPAPSRRHRWLKRVALGIAGLVLLLAALVCWLLLTVTGRDVLLEQVSQRLPTGTTLQWERIDGPLAGPLSVEGLRFDMDDTRFQADRVQLEFSLLPLLGRRLQLQTLELDNAVLELPASSDETTPFTLPNWPDDILPAIQLPLSIHAERIAIDNLLLRQGGADLLRIHGARGGIEVGDGYARVQQLVADTDRGRFGVAGHYEPRRRYRTDLTATAVFPPTGFAQAPARLGLVARGDRGHLVAALAGNAPAPLKLTVEVTGNRRPDWQLHGNTTEFDPATLGLLADRLPLAFDLQAKGHDGVTTLQGTLAQGEYRAEIAPSRLRIENDTVLHVEPLTLLLLDGRAELQGKVDLTTPEDPRFDLAIDAAGLHWGEGANAISGDATLTLTGQLKAWAAKGEAALALDKRKASIHFDGNGDDVQARLQELRVEMPGGRLDASGDIGWAQALRWKAEAKLAGFDPAFFLPGWNGAISGKLASEGQLREDGGVDASLDIPQLGGRLRGRALDGRGNFALRGEEGEGDLQLRLGDSRITANGTVGQRLDVRAQLQPVHLADLLPDAQGSLGGHLHVGGTRTAPVIEADLAASGIDWQGYTVANASLRGRLPWSGEDGQLQLQGNGISAGVDVQRLRVELRGAVQQLQFDADADTGYGAAAITGSAQQQRGNWSAELEKLRLAPLKGGAWQLREPTRFAQNGQAFSLTPLCLETRDNGGGALCLQADWPGEGVSLQADALPLSLLQPWLPENTGRELGLRGDLRLQAQLKPQGRSWAGEIHVASLEGGLRLGNSGQRELIRYDNLTLDATLDPQAIQARLGVGFQGDGYIDASAHTGWDDFSALQGDAYFHNASLFWMELLSPDLVRPQGVLAGHIAVAGTRGQPLMSGEATLADFRGELPSLGIELIDGQGALSALADGSARLQARFGSQSATGGKGKTAAGGNVDVEGSLSWLDGSVPLHFVVRGENFLVSDTTQLHAVASPDVIVEIGTEATRVSGKVTIPSARIDIEKLDTGVSASEDVVVLDPADPTRTPSARLDLQLAIALGEDVHLNGYGLEGGLEGTLNIRSRLGQSMAATGQLRVDGRYTAYGQKLQITEGQLDWSNSPVSDPNISLRAEREVISAGVTAGISVTGRASQPRARVWSDPELPESDALAYLVLGRSLNTASSDESQQINAAQSALSAGAGLLASQLGAKIGLDDAGVLESRTLGGSVFGVGKYLSPKLYVSYGVSMVGAGSAVTLKYLMRKGFDMEIESSTVESRGSLNWRREK